jgi:cell division transport system permease protein
MLLKIITKTFMIITGILGFLLIVKQLEVWKLSHSERMYIMELFGAPFWFKGAALFKIALLDSFIAIISTMGLIYIITSSALYQNIITELNINFTLNYFKEFLILFIVSFSISLISSILVVISKK